MGAAAAAAAGVVVVVVGLEAEVGETARPLIKRWKLCGLSWMIVARN